MPASTIAYPVVLCHPVFLSGLLARLSLETQVGQWKSRRQRH